MQVRCMLCGRLFEPDVCDICESEDDDLFTPPEKKKKPSAVCPMCQAKLKHEADKTQKPQKPM